MNENVAKAHLADTKLAEKYAIVDMDISIPIYIAFSRSEVGQLVKQAFAKNYQQLT